MKDNKLNETKFKGQIKIERVRYYKNNWGIILASVVKTEKGYANPQLDRDGYMVIKGVMPKPETKTVYVLDCNLISDPKWGDQYEIVNISTSIQFDVKDKVGQRKYLLSIYTEGQVAALYKAMESPFHCLDTGDFESLVQAKGIGVKKAMWMIDKFHDNYSIARMITELSDYGLTTAMMKKLVNRYKSTDLAIEKVKTNPYILATEVNGIGWNKADEIALSGKMTQYCSERVKAFILFYLDKQAQNGYNYISTDCLMDGIVESIGEEVSDFTVAEAIHSLGDELWYNDEKTFIGLMKYYKLEEKIAKELLRIRDAKSDFKTDGWEEAIHKLEVRQGWSFTDQQKEGVEAVLNNNVVCITGQAGCVDCDTEFFDGYEWKRIADYKKGDKVLQYNKNGTAELVEPLNYIKQPSKQLWHFRTKRGVDQCLSDNHRVLYTNKDGTKEYVKTMAQIKEKHDNSKTGFYGKFITAFNYNGDGINLSDDIIRVCVAIFADGTFYYQLKEHCNTYNKVRLHLKKQRKKERLKQLLDKANIKYEVKESSADGYNDFYFMSPIGRQKTFPKDWYNCSNDQLKVIADEVMYWDGDYNTKNIYNTTIKSDADFIQFVFSSLNKRASINVVDRTGKKRGSKYIRKSVEYRVIVSEKRLVGICEKKVEEKIKIEPYKTLDGYEYCFTVPSDTLILRRNNKIFVTKNCGKTSIAVVMLEVLQAYSHCLCALSGRAGSRIGEVTGEDGYTIHRLLGFPSNTDTSKNSFAYHDENPLPYDIIIVDEISMIGARLWYSLLRAVKSGAKLILLGDISQLESIGEGNVASDLIESAEIPTVILDKIHRQAAKSAIITESLKIRNGDQIISKDWVGENVRGELRDLLIDCYSDKTNTFYKVVEHFQKEIGLVPSILDLQIICPVKTKGDACTWNINNAIQELYNPESKDKKQVEVFNRGKITYLREGDKVINCKNNYKSVNANGEITPCFNGQIGILREIDEANGAYTIDFQDVGTIIVNKEQLNSIELGYASTGHKCVTEDTWIYTNDGIKQLKELNNGAKVNEQKELANNIKVYNGSYLEKPSHFYNAGIADCKHIVTKKGYELTGTLEHGIDVLGEDGYIHRKNIGDLTENDYVIIRKGQEVYGNTLDLPKEWFDSRSNVKAKTYPLPEKMSIEFAQFLGQMIADGTLTQKKIHYVKHQKKTVKVFNSLIKKLFNYDGNVVKEYDDVHGWLYQTEIMSTYIKEFLWHIEGIKPYDKFVPECVLKAAKEYHCAFLRGVFEEGTVHIKNNKFNYIKLSLCHKKLIKQIQMMLLNLGIVSSYKHTSKGKMKDRHTLYIYKRDAKMFKELIGFESYNKIEKLNLVDKKTTYNSDNYMIPYIDKIILKLCKENSIKMEHINKSFSWLETRHMISLSMLELFLHKTKETLGETKEYKYLEVIANNYYIDPIQQITETKEQTYCLTMPETHKFVQNGIQAWNCQGSQWSHIIVALDYSAYTLLSREWLYTAITRAKEHATLIAQNSALRFAISQNKISEKTSYLVGILDELAHPKIIF